MDRWKKLRDAWMDFLYNMVGVSDRLARAELKAADRDDWRDAALRKQVRIEKLEKDLQEEYSKSFDAGWERARANQAEEELRLIRGMDDVYKHVAERAEAERDKFREALQLFVDAWFWLPGWEGKIGNCDSNEVYDKAVAVLKGGSNESN